MFLGAIGVHRRASAVSGQRFFDYPAVVDGGSFETAVVEIGKICMVESEKMKNRGVNVVNMAASFNPAQSDLIRASNDLTAPDSAARHPDGETPRVMIPPVPLFIE